MSKNDHIVTIKDIAAMSGVSISTVSNVLNGKTNKVSREVAEKINKIVEKTGYRPNYLAKSLRANSTKTIGVIAEDLIVFSSGDMIEGIMDRCEKNGYNVVIENMRLFGRWDVKWMHDEALFHSALIPVLNKMDAMNVDGIIYVGGHEHTVNNLVSINSIPIVMAYAIAGDKSIPTFRLDDETGGYEVMCYLIAKGHTRIGIIAGESDNVHTKNRMIGIQRALFENRILFDPDLVEFGPWSKNAGYVGMKDLLKKGITAVFCMSDAIASGAYAALNELGLIPGKDLAVFGYDNQEVSSFLTPGLTTMALPLRKIGAMAADKILGICEKEITMEESICDIRVRGTLIERDSVNSLIG